MRLQTISKFSFSATLILFFSWCFSVQSQSLPVGSRSDTTTFMLNEKAVQIISYQYGDPHIGFVALHDTEKTGLKAAFRFMRIYGGYAVELQYGGLRNINFSDSLQKFSFDPNSMFTDEGAYMGLVLSSVPQVPYELIGKVRNLGTEVLKLCNADSAGFLIALHNNYDGGFSTYSYTDGNYLETSAEDVYINPNMDPDNFVFVTDRRFFEYLKRRETSVVLQSTEVPDDGSLSVYAMQNKIPYANIEVQHGQLDENYRIILIVNDMVKEVLAKDAVSKN